MNLENTIKKASEILKNYNISSYEIDAEIILADIMKVEREYLITNNDVQLVKKIEDKYFKAIKTIIGIVINDINVDTTIMLDILSTIFLGEYIEAIK